MKKLVTEINRIREMMGLLLTEGAGKLFKGAYTFDNYITKKAAAHNGDQTKLFDELKIKSSKSTESSPILIKSTAELKNEVDDILSKEMKYWTPKEKEFMKDVNSKLLDETDLKNLATAIDDEFGASMKNPMFEQEVYNELGEIMQNSQVEIIRKEVKIKNTEGPKDYYVGTAFKNREEEQIFRDWLYNWERYYNKPGYFTELKYLDEVANTGITTKLKELWNKRKDLLSKQGGYDPSNLKINRTASKDDIEILSQVMNDGRVTSQGWTSFDGAKSNRSSQDDVFTPNEKIKIKKSEERAKYLKLIFGSDWKGVGARAAVAAAIGLIWWWFNPRKGTEIALEKGEALARGMIQAIEDQSAQKWQEQTRNQLLVRQVLNRVITREYIEQKFKPLKFDDLILLSDEELLKIVGLFNNCHGDYDDAMNLEIRNAIYACPDAISLIRADELCKEKYSKTLKELLFDRIDNFDEEKYYDSTVPPAGEGLILSLIVNVAFIKLEDKLANLKDEDLLKEIKKGTKFPQFNVTIDKEELKQASLRVAELKKLENWVKLNDQNVRYVGEPLNEYYSNKLIDAKEWLNKALQGYFEEKNKQSIANFKDLYDINEIVGGVNKYWGDTPLKGFIDIKNPNIFSEGAFQQVEYNPEKKKQSSDTTGSRLKNIFRRKQNNQQPKPEQGKKEKKEKKSGGVAFENYNVVGLGKLLIENQSTAGDFDWRAALFQNRMDITKPTGWKGNPPKKVNQNPQNGWGTFDSETKTLYDSEVEDGSYPKELIDQVEKVFFKIYNKKFRFELNDSGDFITLQGNPSIYQSILDTLNYGPTQDFEAIFFMGVMKIKEYKGTVTSIQVSDATAAILKKNELIIKQIINPKDK